LTGKTVEIDIIREYTKLLNRDIVYDDNWRNRDDLYALNDKVKAELKYLDNELNQPFLESGVRISNLSSHNFLSKEGYPTWQLDVISHLWTDGVGLDLEKVRKIRWAFLVHRRGGKSRLMDLISFWLCAKYPDISILAGMANGQYFADFHTSIIQGYLPATTLDSATLAKMYKPLMGEIKDYKKVFNIFGSSKISGKNRMLFPNGSQFAYIGIKTESPRGRGEKIVLFWMDEVAFLPEFGKVATQSTPILQEMRGGMILISTAYPGWYENYVKKVSEDCQLGRKGKMVFNYHLYNSGLYNQQDSKEIAEQFYDDQILGGETEDSALIKGAQEGFNYFGEADSYQKLNLFPRFKENPENYIIDYISAVSTIRNNINEYSTYTIIDYGGGESATAVLFCAKNIRDRQLIIYDELDLRKDAGNISNTCKEIYTRINIHGINPQYNLLDSQAIATGINFSEESKFSYLNSYNQEGGKYQLNFGIINRKTGGKVKAIREEVSRNIFETSEYLSDPITKTGTGQSVYVTNKCTSLIKGLIDSKVTRGQTDGRTKKQADRYYMVNDDIIDAFYYAITESFSTKD
jgi:hypothetical protein